MSSITPPDYKKIASQVRRQPISVADNEIEDSLLWIQKSRAKLSQIMRSCRIGDFVEIQFETGIDHKSYQDSFILGDGKYVPGFEEQIEGMEAGEAKSFSLKLPNDYAKKELAGTVVGFKVNLQSVQKVELPELTDEFVRSLGKFDGLVQLRASMREGLQWEKDAVESRRVRREILDGISQEADPEVPDVLIRAEQEKMIELLRNEVTQKLQMDFQEYLTKSHQSEDKIRDHFLPEARKQAKDLLILKAIAAAESIEVTEKEINEGAAEFLSKYSNGQDAEKELDPLKLRAYIEDVIRQEKTLTKLEEYAKKLN